jgi:hypothetical protein
MQASALGGFALPLAFGKCGDKPCQTGIRSGHFPEVEILSCLEALTSRQGNHGEIAMNFRITTALCLALPLFVLTASAESSDWANRAFNNRHHNFGTVARAAKVEHVFEFTNPFNQTLHVSGVRASCGCTTPIVLTQSVKPGEKGQIMARFNTRSFLGQRGATLTVVFDRPRYGEAQLRVDGYVRKDVVCNPGEIAFGTVAAGKTAVKRVDIQYSGQPNWKILGAESPIPGLDLTVEETSRQGGRVGYVLTATYTPNSKAGYLQGDIQLKTSDSGRGSVPLQFSGKVVEPISASPSPMLLGSLPPNTTLEKKLILRGEEPFRVVSVQSNDDRVQCDFDDQAKKLHIIPVRLASGSSSQPIDCLLEITTDCEAAPRIEIKIEADIP